MYYLGIDGGGTKTAFGIINEHGDMIETIIKGTCHYLQVGIDGCRHILQEGITEILNKLSLSPTDIVHCCIGMPGYGEVKKDEARLNEMLKDIMQGITYTVCNDVALGLALVKEKEAGISIVAGTGSMAVAVDKDGKLYRCGGWGHQSAGDEGSAYWIGKEAIRLFCHQADGRKEKGPLYDEIKATLHLKEDFDIISYVVHEIKENRGDIAQLSKCCYRAAQRGDRDAKNIFERAAKELASLAICLYKQINHGEEIMIYCHGGVFQAGEYLLEPLQKELQLYEMKLIITEIEPVQEACLLAKKEGIVREKYDGIIG